MKDGHFVSDIEVERHPGERQRFTLMKPLIYRRDSGTEITVLDGFVTDGASVPRLLWPIAPPFSGPYMSAAVLHDALYTQGVFSRVESDSIFLEAMLASNVPFWQCAVLHCGVVIGGWWAWRKHRKADNGRTVLTVGGMLNE